MSKAPYRSTTTFTEHVKARQQQFIMALNKFVFAAMSARYNIACIHIIVLYVLKIVQCQKISKMYNILWYHFCGIIGIPREKNEVFSTGLQCTYAIIINNGITVNGLNPGVMSYTVST